MIGLTKVYKYHNEKKSYLNVSHMWINVTLDLSSVRRLISRHIFRMLFMAPQGMRGPGQRFLHQHTACFYIFGVPKDSSFDPFIKRLWVRQITAKKKGVSRFYHHYLSKKFMISLFTPDTTLDSISIISFIHNCSNKYTFN